MLFLPAVVPPPTLSSNAWWFLFHGDRLLVEAVRRGRDSALGSTGDAGLSPVRTQFLGTLDGTPCYSGELAEEVEPEDMFLRALRPCSGATGRDVLPRRKGVPGHGLGSDAPVLREVRGTTDPLAGERGEPASVRAPFFSADYAGRHRLRCPGRHDSPCAIQQVPCALLQRAGRIRRAGETFEECVRREIREEVGIEVEDLRYFGSQPWPFPHSLMVGFTASFAAETSFSRKRRSFGRAGSARRSPPAPDTASWHHRQADDRSVPAECPPDEER